MLLRHPLHPAAHEELTSDAVGVVHRRMERVTTVAHHLVHLRAVRAETDEQETRAQPRLHRVDPGRAVGPKRRVETHLPVEPLPSELGELGLCALELSPGGHPGLP